MQESGNHNFPIRQSQSPGVGFCDILAKAEGLQAVANLVEPGLTWTAQHGSSFQTASEPKMDDFKALMAWIQPQHLVPSGVEACWARFEHHRPHVLHLTDFLKEDIAAGLGRFLSREADYRTVYRLHPSSPHRLRSSAWVSEDIWQQVQEDERFYSL